VKVRREIAKVEWSREGFDGGGAKGKDTRVEAAGMDVRRAGPGLGSKVQSLGFRVLSFCTC